MALFLDAAEFTAKLDRDLDAGEEAQLGDLLAAADEWIRERKPGIEDDNPSARVVVFEVVRDALEFGIYARFQMFSRTTGGRTVTGMLKDALPFLPRHFQMLGLTAIAAPEFDFPKCDY